MSSLPHTSIRRPLTRRLLTLAVGSALVASACASDSSDTAATDDGDAPVETDTGVATDDVATVPVRTTPTADGNGRSDTIGCSVDLPSACVSVTDGAPADERYTLLNVTGAESENSETILIDGNGNVVNTWDSNGTDASPLPEPGHVLLAQDGPDDPEFATVTQFESQCLAIIDASGAAVWPEPAPAEEAECGEGIDPIPYGTTDTGAPSALAHHDQQLWGAPVYDTPAQTDSTGDGRVLYVGHTLVDPSDLEGVAAEMRTEPFNDDVLVELAADGETVLWEWSPMENIDQMGFDDDQLAAIASTGVGADFELPAGAAGGLIPDPSKIGFLFINSASYLGPNQHCEDPEGSECDHRFHPDNVLVAGRQSATMFIVARHDDPNGEFVEGDIVWEMGADIGADDEARFIGQHHVHMIPEGLPGAGNILMLDNGQESGYGLDSDGQPSNAVFSRDHSRIVEIDPITEEVVWTYEEVDGLGDGTPSFYTANQGSAQRLENGNTLIAEGNTGRVFEVTPEDDIVWEFAAPFPALEVQSPTGAININTYRAYRVSESWVTAS